MTDERTYALRGHLERLLNAIGQKSTHDCGSHIWTPSALVPRARGLGVLDLSAGPHICGLSGIDLNDVSPEEYLGGIQFLLATLGEDGWCKASACRAPIFWVLTKNGKRAPFSINGATHFSDCAGRAQFTGGKR